MISTAATTVTPLRRHHPWDPGRFASEGAVAAGIPLDMVSPRGRASGLDLDQPGGRQLGQFQRVRQLAGVGSAGHEEGVAGADHPGPYPDDDSGILSDL